MIWEDPIRRGDVAKAMADYHWKRYSSRVQGGELSSPAVFTSHTWQDVQDIIASLPAVQPAPEVAALVKALKTARPWVVTATDECSGWPEIAGADLQEIDAALAAMEGRDD